MVPTSPIVALGSHADAIRPLLVDTVRFRHDRSAEAHQVSESRYAMGFGSQWRDLLDDSHAAMHARGYRTHKLAPGGYKVSVVNDCLVYVWRVPVSAEDNSADEVSSFASSPTRRNGFAALPPDPMLFEPGFTGESELTDDSPEQDEPGRVLRAAGDAMPLVLVIVRSSPRRLHSIEWAVAELAADSGKVKLHGRESLWQPESGVEDAATDVEPFDSGIPTGPALEPQEQETQPDA